MSYKYGDVIAPNGKSGNWEVLEVEVSKYDEMLSSRNSAIFHCPAGKYKSLAHNGFCVMSNTPMELRTNHQFVRRATGKVHINGLGLGVVLLAVLVKPAVESVTVVEKSSDVIALVAPSFAKFSNILTIIHDDALTYKPPAKAKFQAVWHDIWNSICADNLDDMKLLHRRWARRTDWQGSWSRDLIR